jgi:hypothetical protein
LATGRRTYYDLVAEPLVNTDLPGFTDLLGKAVWSPRPGQRLTAFGLLSRERTDADLEGDAGERLLLQTSTHNDLAAVSFSAPIGLRAVTKTTVSWCRSRDLRDFQAASTPASYARTDQVTTPSQSRISSLPAASACAILRSGTRRS